MNEDEGKIRYTFDELLSADEENRPGSEAQECEYRRGYADGWIQAVEAIHDLMFSNHLSRHAAYDACWAHWRDALATWRHTDTDRLSKSVKVPYAIRPAV